jgi:predicted SAM-dependent methyltransferase
MHGTGMGDPLRPGFSKRLKSRFWSLFPRHAIAPFRFELRMLKLRRRASLVRRRYRGARGLLVNLGAGPHGKPGWVNVDVSREPGINCVYDIRWDLPFEEGSVAGIFCEHVLEHLHRAEEATRFLKECLRVLEPGGALRVVVPDCGRYLRAYAGEGWAALDALRGTDAEHRDPWFGVKYRTRMELVNTLFRQDGEHQYAYDAETLLLDLREAGFARVLEQKFGSSVDPRLLLDHPPRAAESLYVDAVKG